MKRVIAEVESFRPKSHTPIGSMGMKKGRTILTLPLNFNDLGAGTYLTFLSPSAAGANNPGVASFVILKFFHTLWLKDFLHFNPRGSTKLIGLFWTIIP